MNVPTRWNKTKRWKILLVSYDHRSLISNPQFNIWNISYITWQKCCCHQNSLFFPLSKTHIESILQYGNRGFYSPGLQDFLGGGGGGHNGSVIKLHTVYTLIHLKLTNINPKTLQFRKVELEPESICSTSKIEKKIIAKTLLKKSFLTQINVICSLQKVKMLSFHVWGALPQISINQPSIHII